MIPNDEIKPIRLLHGKSKSISFNNKKLKLFPESVCLLQSLVSLDGRNNEMKTLPLSFSLLTNLENLNLSNNHFEIIPEVISTLINLKKIHIFSNPLQDITSICSLSNLQFLNLNNCKLSHLPPEICFLKSLQVLSLDHNELTSFPDEICELISLRELMACKNKLEYLPFNFGKLVNLSKLLLSQNKLKELPETIVEIKSLRKLDVASNFLRIFPIRFDAMFLNELYCESNLLLEKITTTSIQEPEILSLRELTARFLMKELKNRSSVVQKTIHFYPKVKEIISESSKCPVCLELFLDIWLECVKFVSPSKDLGMSFCNISSVPQRVLLCSYSCFNSNSQKIYGIAYP